MAELVWLKCRNVRQVAVFVVVVQSIAYNELVGDFESDVVGLIETALRPCLRKRTMDRSVAGLCLASAS